MKFPAHLETRIFELLGEKGCAPVVIDEHVIEAACPCCLKRRMIFDFTPDPERQ